MYFSMWNLPYILNWDTCFTYIPFQTILLISIKYDLTPFNEIFKRIMRVSKFHIFHYLNVVIWKKKMKLSICYEIFFPFSQQRNASKNMYFNYEKRTFKESNFFIYYIFEIKQRGFNKGIQRKNETRINTIYVRTDSVMNILNHISLTIAKQ